TKYNWRWRTTLWDVTSAPKEIGSFSERPTVSPDGEGLAVPLDSGACLVSVIAPERRRDLVVKGDQGALLIVDGMKNYPTLSFSPDSKMLAVKELFRFGQEPFLGQWLPPSLSPFSANSHAAYIRLWDTASGREIFC